MQEYNEEFINRERNLFRQKENVHKKEIEVLEKKIFVSNLKAWIIGIFLLAEIILVGLYFSKSGLFDTDVTGGNKVAIVRYNKPVTEAFTTTVMEKLDAIKKDTSYKSVLFIMGSPGGSPTASEELSEYLKEYQKDINVTMYVDSIAASGGYYIASAVKPLIANKNAIVGSIGVIMPHYNFGELAKKIGVEEDFMSAGKFKKPISMLAKIDDENRKYMTEHLLKPTYDNFLQSVADNRGLKKEDVIPFAEGQIFIANVPKIQGILIDEISSLYKVKKRIRESFKEKIEFVDVSLEKRRSFFPEIKVDVDLQTLSSRVELR